MGRYEFLEIWIQDLSWNKITQVFTCRGVNSSFRKIIRNTKLYKDSLSHCLLSSNLCLLTPAIKKKNFRDVYYIHTRLSDFLKGSSYYKTRWPREKKSNHVSNSGTNFKKMFFKVLFVIGIMLPEISSDIVDLNSKLIIWYFWICDS